MNNKYYSKVINLYNSKKRDFNKYLAYDFIVHHHNGILDKNIFPENEEHLKEILHKSETALSELMIKELSIKNGFNILDAGCGRGGNSILISKKYPETNIYALNISDYQINFFRKLKTKMGLTNIKIYKRYMENTGFKKNFFDRIFACESTEHVFPLSNFFKEMSKIARPKSKLVIVAWTLNDKVNPSDTAIKRINHHYVTKMHRKKEYISVSSEYEWKLDKIIDLTSKTVNYWRIRNQSVQKTGIEDLMYNTFKTKKLLYLLYKYTLVK